MITVIGAGLVGSAVVEDMSRDFEVAVFDKSPKALSSLGISRKYAEDVFSRKEILQHSDVVITTLPGSASYAVVKKLLGMGKSVVDTSFMEEDPFTLDGTARKHRAVYVPDAGYAPGITNVLAGRLYKQENVNALEIVVAGLPLKPVYPFLHAATFNVEGLIDEYTRPARIVRQGKVVSVDPLGEISTMNFGDAGRFDSFYSDGLRTLLRTIKVQSMFEKTLRYPGHLQSMKLLRDLGYFSSDEVGGLVPRSVTESIFSSFDAGFKDMCLTRVSGFNARKFEYTNSDRYNAKTGTKSMARMTGYSAASMARILLEGMIDVHGVHPPEYLGFSDREFSRFISLLGRKGIRFGYAEQ